MKRTIQEHRLSKGLTIQAAAKLGKVSISSLRRWEKGGARRADAFLMWNLLEAYGTKIDFTDFNRIPTDKQRVECMMAGCSTVMHNGQNEVDLLKLNNLLKSEGFDVTELEAICVRERKKRSIRGNGVSA